MPLHLGVIFHLGTSIMDAIVAGVGTVPDAGDREAFVASTGEGSEDAKLAVCEEGAINAGVMGAARGRHWCVPLGAASFA